MIDPVQVSSTIDGVVRVALHGAIVFANADDVRAAIRNHLERVRPRCVRLDLSDVNFLDSSGVAVLVVTRRLAQRLGADCRIDDPSPPVLEHLRLTGLAQLFGLRRSPRKGA